MHSSSSRSTRRDTPSDIEDPITFTKEDLSSFLYACICSVIVIYIQLKFAFGIDLMPTADVYGHDFTGK